MKTFWNNISRDNVLKAIEIFDKNRDSYPEPRNTFLLFNNNKYPAKHIRGLAYFVANKKEILKNEFSGGLETAKFFRKLGFDIEYKKGVLKPKATSIKKENVTIKAEEKVILEKGEIFTSKKVKKLNVVSQKNYLQKILQKHFGHIETEKKFEWLKTPNQENLPKDYKLIVEKLSNYREQLGFKKSNRSLLCDIVLEDRKLIIEYDENQHFTFSRKITLQNYPENIKLHYSKNYWISACEKINAKDNNPIDRDEKRAFYDAVRDIEAFKNGYQLIRIKHGDFDWSNENAEMNLNQLLSLEPTKINKTVDNNHKIARIIVTGKQYYTQYEKRDEHKLINLGKIIDKFVTKTYLKEHFEFILTPGGFLTFRFPEKLQNNFDVAKAEDNEISTLQKIAEAKINEFFNSLKIETLRKLKTVADYFTIGIDGFNQSRINSIELVAVYDLKEGKVINWTGKFYPTEFQKKNLIKINDLNTHFIKLNNQNIVILGCHDLNVYNPRGQANSNPESWKKQIADKFKKMCAEFNPDVILQHPHTTDTPNIWNLAWITLEKELPNVKHFASGIKYYNNMQQERSELSKVLEKTKKGDVTDFFYDL